MLRASGAPRVTAEGIFTGWLEENRHAVRLAVVAGAVFVDALSIAGAALIAGFVRFE